MTRWGTMRSLCMTLLMLSSGFAAEPGTEPAPEKPFKHDTDLSVLARESIHATSDPVAPEVVEAEVQPTPVAPVTTNPNPPAAPATPDPEPLTDGTAPASGFLPATAADGPGAAFGPEALPESPSPQLLRLQQTYETAPPPLAWSPEESGEQPELVQLATKATMWLLAICASIILLGLLLRRLGRRTPLLAGNQLGQVLGRVHLTPKAALHFVRSGGRVLVLGVTPGGVSLVSEYDADAFERASQPAAQPVRPAAMHKPFEERLRENVARLDEASAPQEDDDIAALRGDIERLRGHLRETTRDPRDV